MDTSEIKARIASILDIPLNQVILKQNDKVTANFSFQNGKFVIEYKDTQTLTHEFLHGCFSPRLTEVNKTVNALEDYRISIKAEQYDKRLAECNSEGYTQDMVEKVLRETPPTEDGSKLNALKIASIAKQSKVDIRQLLDKYSQIPKEGKDLIMSARESIAKDTTFTNLAYWAERINEYCQLSDQKEQNSRVPKEVLESLDEKEIDSKPKESVEEDYKKELKAKGEVERLSKRDEVVLVKALNNILRNKAIGKKQNTIKGKLKTKRLGHYPSNFLFEKKDRPKPETSLYVMIDISGSMDDNRKLPTVIKFMNSLRLSPIKNLNIQLRCFNAEMFSNDEIPYYEGDIKNELMFREIPNRRFGPYCGYNDDAHFLKEIINEIQSDPTPNKSLLILSDGQPAPSSLYEDKDLENVAKIKLVKSKIPYMSIGIFTHEVEDYYEKSRSAYSTTELVDLLLRYSTDLVKC